MSEDTFQIIAVSLSVPVFSMFHRPKNTREQLSIPLKREIEKCRNRKRHVSTVTVSCLK